MKRAIFPGSFDPLTYGHVDIIKRASKLFDEVIVVILDNSEKRNLLTLDERMMILHHAIMDMENVHCDSASGLTIDFAKKEGACAIIRGIRSIKDYEYELNIASINHHMNPEIETILLFSDARYAYVSSSMVRELISYGRNIEEFVTKETMDVLRHKV